MSIRFRLSGIQICLIQVERETSTYILTVAFFEVDSEIVLTHSLIDYNDKLGIRDEINSMKWDAIKKIL